jgi:glutamine amidotransferase
MISVVDYGMGNLRSVVKAFERLQCPVVVTSSEKDLLKATKIVLPGVGHFAYGMKKIEGLHLRPVLDFLVQEKQVPVLGICLGMQLMTLSSEEGNAEGLKWIQAETVRLDPGNLNPGLKIPHMGWNTLGVRKDHPMARHLKGMETFYFVHSFHVRCHNPEDILFTTTYGMDFVSGFSHRHLTGVQFHPEKSHAAGLQMIRGFIGS